MSSSDHQPNIEEEIATVKTLLGKAKLEAVLDKLKNIIAHIPNKAAQKKLEERRVLLNAQFHDNEQKFLSRLINYQEHSQAKAKIHGAIFLFCGECLEMASGNQTTNSKQPTKRQITIMVAVIGCLLAVALFFIFWGRKSSPDNKTKAPNTPTYRQDTIKGNDSTTNTIKHTQKPKKDTCREQNTKLRVDIAHFEATGSQPFASRLISDVKDQAQLPENVLRVDLCKSYLPTKQQLTSRICGYRGLMVYGTRSTTSGNQSLTCTIDIINVKKVEASHRIEEPSHLNFEIDEHSEYISYFISGLLKFYLGLNNQANKDFNTFLSKTALEKKTLKKNKLMSYCKYYLGRLKLEQGDVKGAVALLKQSKTLFKTKFCAELLSKLETDGSSNGKPTADLKTEITHATQDIPAALRRALRNPLGIKKLDLSHKNLSTLPESIGELQDLEVLNLSYNRLTKLPESITKLQNLTTLYLFRNQLTTLPKGIEKLQKLTKLYLSNNKLTTLPKGIEKLQNLAVLNLSGNQLTALPKGIEKLQKLSILNLCGNKLTTLPKGIEKLQNLSILYLPNDKLTRLPKGIEKLQNLSILNLCGNKLTRLPKGIEKLQNLAELNLSGNQLTVLPKGIEKLQNLPMLGLSFHKLTTLPKGIEKLQKLFMLNLRGNQLTALPKGIEKLQNLSMLNLSSNRLTTLPKGIEKLQNLIILDLANNKLTTLPKGIEKLQNLTRLYLKNNPINKTERQKIKKLLPKCNIVFW
jgi:Leucine-rich repeat (LRR) protein